MNLLTTSPHYKIDLVVQRLLGCEIKNLVTITDLLTGEYSGS